MSDRSADTRAYEETKRLRVDDYINAVAWNADGSRLAALSNFGGTVTLWDSHSWAVVNMFHRYGGAYSANSLAFLPDGTLLTAAPIGVSPDPNYETLAIFALIQWNAETGQAVRYIPDLGHMSKDLSDKIGPADTFVVSADGSTVAGITKGENVVLFETRSWSVARRFATPPTPKHGDYAAALAISPNGRQIAIGTGSGYVHLFSIDDPAPSLSFRAFSPFSSLIMAPSCNALAFSSDGRFLATSEVADIREPDNGWTRIWNVSDGAMIANFAGYAAIGRSLAWDSSGNFLAIGGDYGMQLWEIGDLPQSPRQMKKNRSNTYSVKFSPQGKLAASSENKITIYQ